MKNIATIILLLLTVFCNAQKPNVVLILIDDISHYGVSAYGAKAVNSQKGHFENAAIQTPEIDKLAERGIICTHAYTYPLCEATRIALMSGKVNNRNYLQCKSQHASDITFGDVFQRAGYATGMFGKWKQTRGTKEIAGEKYIYEFGWDEFTCFDVTMEGQRFINPNLVVNGETVNYNNRTDTDPETGRRWYGPDICNRHAINFIEKHKDEPFFLYYPMLLIHDDHKPTPDTKPNTIFDNFDEANHNRDGHTGDDPKYLPHMVAYMDKLIGNIVNKIDELGLRDNTLIVVMGDNGTKETFSYTLANNTTYPARKGGNADNGIHVPLILNMPSAIKPYGKYEGLVYVTDIFPTLAEACGIIIPNKDQIDGISFWPQTQNVNTEHRNVIYSWYNGNNPYTSTETILEYAFTKDYKRYAPSMNYHEGRFFDLRTDILERFGENYVELKWGLRRYSGLDINYLTPEQKQAYIMLGKILDDNRYVKVNKLEISAHEKSIKPGNYIDLSCSIIPANATRNNVIWVTDNSNIATIDKFGRLYAHKNGKVTVSVYSWDDAEPLSANMEQTYKTTGISDSISIIVSEQEY